MTVFRIAVLVLFSYLLSGCGGGGGGSGNEGPAGAAEFRLSLDRTALTFQATQGSVPPSQTIVATWTGTPPDPVYVTATVEGAGIAPTIPIQITQTSATATVSVSAGLLAGNFTGRINFLVCRDAACTQPVGGSPLAVNFTVTVAAGSVSSTAPIAFEYVAGNALPAPRKVQVASDAGAWTVAASAAWVSLSPTSGQGAGSFDVSFDPAFAAAGTQTASITVNSVKGIQVIPVSLTFTTPTTGGGGATSGEFTLSATNVAFSARRSRAAPASQSLQLHISDTQPVSVGAAFVTSAPDWVGVSITGQAPDYLLTLRVTNTNKPVGTTSAVLAVGTFDATGTVLQRKDVTITLEILDVMSASAAAIAPSFVLGSSMSAASSTISVSAHATTSWTVTSSVPWVSTSVSSGAGNALVGVTVDTASLDLGSYTGSVTIANAGDPTNTVSIPVSTNVTAPAISITGGPVVMGGADGLGSDGGSIALTLNTGTNTYPWAATATTANGDAWLTLPAASGQVGSASTNIAVDAVRTLVDPGSHQGTVSVQISVRGHTYSRSVPVVLNKEGHWLQVSSRGAAFSSFPSRSVLSRSMQVASSRGRTDVPWSATSDASWLSVTASGTTGGSLLLTANPAGLPQETTHIATVTIASSDPEIENQESIRVAFWAGATDPQDQSVSGALWNVVANPVEPWVYANSGGNTIQIYNVYTGALVNTWTTALASIGDMAMSQDGTLLFVNDTSSHAVVALNAQTGSTVRTYAYTQNSSSLGIAYVNVGARPTLITGVGNIFDVASGALHSSSITAGWYGGMLSFAVDPLSRYFYTQNMGVSASSLTKYSIKRTALTDDGIVVEPLAGNSGGSNGRDACVSSDGARVYTANGHPYMFYVFASSSFQFTEQLPGHAYPNNAECGWSGIFVGGADAYYELEDVWVYRPDGSLVTSLKMGNTTYTYLLESTLVLSGDNTRVIGGTSIPSLAFKGIPSP